MPDVYAVAAVYREEMLALDRKAARRIAEQYRGVYTELQKRFKIATDELERLRADPEATQLEIEKALFKSDRWRQAYNEARDELQRFNAVAKGITQDAQGEAIDLGAEHMDGLMRAAISGNRGDARGPLGIDYSFAKPDTQAMAAMIGFASNGSPLASLFQSISPEALGLARGVLAQGVALGTSPVVIGKQLAGPLGLPAWRGLTIARTETLRAYREAQRQTIMANDDVLEGWIWHSARDRRTCEVCWSMDGRLFTVVAGLTDTAGHQSVAVDAVKATDYLEGHVNCVTAESVVGGPPAELAYRREFTGTIIDIETAAGDFLSVTPNHPVLTPGGWVEAHFLREGDEVLCHDRSNRTVAAHTDDRQMHPRIGDLFESMRAGGSLPVRRGPSGVGDFHGDGAEGNIEIVAAEGFLEDGIRQQRGEHARFGGSVGLVALLGQGAIGEVGVGQRPADHAAPSALRKSAVLVGRTGGHEYTIGIPRATDDLAVGLEEAPNGGPTDAVPSADSLLRFAGPVRGQNIVRIGRRPFVGHVYNLQTTGGWYTAGGIVVKNCRCTLIPRPKSYGDILGDPSLPDERPPISTGAEEFAKLSPGQQASILGPGKFALFQMGVPLEAFVNRVESSAWGASRVAKPLFQLAEELKAGGWSGGSIPPEILAGHRATRQIVPAEDPYANPKDWSNNYGENMREVDIRRIIDQHGTGPQ